MRDFRHWLNAAIREMPEYKARTGPQPLRIIAEKSGLSYTTVRRASRGLNENNKTATATKVNTADRIAAVLDTSLSTVAEYLEDDSAALLKANTKPPPILSYRILEDTDSADCMRPLFSTWLRDTLTCYDISPSEVSHSIGRSEAYVSSIINKRMMIPTLQAAEDICNCLQFRFCDVLREIEYIQDLVYFCEPEGTGNKACAKAYLKQRAVENEPKLRQWRRSRSGG